MMHWFRYQYFFSPLYPWEELREQMCCKLISKIYLFRIQISEETFFRWKKKSDQ